jgi:hypothetical protein
MRLRFNSSRDARPRAHRRLSSHAQSRRGTECARRDPTLVAKPCSLSRSRTTADSRRRTKIGDAQISLPRLLHARHSRRRNRDSEHSTSCAWASARGRLICPAAAVGWVKSPDERGVCRDVARRDPPIDTPRWVAARACLDLPRVFVRRLDPPYGLAREDGVESTPTKACHARESGHPVIPAPISRARIVHHAKSGGYWIARLRGR